MTKNTLINEILELCNNNLKQLDKGLQIILKSQIDSYTHDKLHLIQEDKRRRAILYLNADNFSDRFVANQISYLNLLKVDIKHYELLIFSHTTSPTLVTLSKYVESLNQQLLAILHEVKEKSECLYDHIHTTLGNRIDEVNKKISLGEIQIEPFGYDEIIVMAETQLINWNKNHDLDKFFRLGEYLTILADSLEEDEENNQLTEDEKIKLFRAKKLINELHNNVKEGIRRKPKK